MARIEKTPYRSYKIGTLPRGCRHCVKGEKLVLFITGVCNRDCFYCPISDEKKNKDVVYANEWDTGHACGPLTKEEEAIILREASLSKACGAGITGGDPLLVCERTAHIIKRLKASFGRKFHIHLYTSLENVTPERLKALYDAGLDEIRFHPSLEDDSLWNRIMLAKRHGWDAGVEIPVIPGYEEKTGELMEYLDGKIDFLNLNELELSDSAANRLPERGYEAKDDESYAVRGSEEAALELMERALEKRYRYTIHYCTVRLKDGIQLAQRIKRRSRSVASGQDELTSEGLLIRGVIYLKETAPGFGYRTMLKNLLPEKRLELLKDLSDAKDKLKLKLGLKGDVLTIDDYKLRILTSEENVRKHASRLKDLGFVPAVVEEYPTKDALEVDVEMI
jgi:uncharacterized protein